MPELGETLADTLANFGVDKSASLSHWGVKGMKWGQRKSRTVSTGTVTDPSSGENVRVVTNHKTGDMIRTASEHNHKLAVEAQLHSHGVSTIGNKDLQAYLSRIELEQKYSKLASAQAEARKSKGKKFIEKLIKDEMNAVANGKKGKIQPVLEMLIAHHKARSVKAATATAASRAASNGAAKVATKAITGVVVHHP